MTTRDAVLAALRDAGPAGVSGERLARELGVSRVTVGNHVGALREAGYEIEASPGTGYRLVAAPDLPLPSEVRPLLTQGFWTRLEGGGATASTNDDARRLARDGAPEGTVVLASEQTGGRGRLGRAWSSPVGGAYLSAVLRPTVAPAELARCRSSSRSAPPRASTGWASRPTSSGRTTCGSGGASLPGCCSRWGPRPIASTGSSSASG